MKKFIVILLSLAFLACALPAAAGGIPTNDAEASLLTADVVLLDIESAGNGYLLHLKLPNSEIAVDAAQSCRFLDSKKNAVSPEVFLRSFKGKKISILFMDMGEDQFSILECRG